MKTKRVIGLIVAIAIAVISLFAWGIYSAKSEAEVASVLDRAVAEKKASLAIDAETEDLLNAFSKKGLTNLSLGILDNEEREKANRLLRAFLADKTALAVIKKYQAAGLIIDLSDSKGIYRKYVSIDVHMDPVSNIAWLSR